ncbi:UNVERIFIED_CONTAM: hypothetical protein PYX00_001930 [Menopon gallinae]|uniref:Uncharacterized protein n=1 Tax=Menopon gallinae TaxID=328185 RepID=A0AAW2IEN6_9NEOP
MSVIKNLKGRRAGTDADGPRMVSGHLNRKKDDGKQRKKPVTLDILVFLQFLASVSNGRTKIAEEVHIADFWINI